MKMKLTLKEKGKKQRTLETSLLQIDEEGIRYIDPEIGLRKKSTYDRLDAWSVEHKVTDEDSAESIAIQKATSDSNKPIIR